MAHGSAADAGGSAGVIRWVSEVALGCGAKCQLSEPGRAHWASRAWSAGKPAIKCAPDDIFP